MCRFHSDEEFVPFDVIACSSGPPAGKGLIEQLEMSDLVRLHEQPVGKGPAAGTGNLIRQ